MTPSQIHATIPLIDDPILPRRAEIPDEKELARDFAKSFIAEMLSAAGLEKSIGDRAGFGGDAMASFLVREYAEKIADAGGFGLSEKIYAQIMRAEIDDAS